MAMGGDYTADQLNAALALVAPDYVPVPSGDPIATALRVIAERLAGMDGLPNGGDQIGNTFDLLAGVLGYIPSNGDELNAAIAAVISKYGRVPPLALVFSNGEPLQFSDTQFLELAA